MILAVPDPRVNNQFQPILVIHESNQGLKTVGLKITTSPIFSHARSRAVRSEWHVSVAARQRTVAKK
jgi:hypothetical protein